MRSLLSTGFNALVRSVGSSLGSQGSASILAGSIVAGGLPSDGSFQTAFSLSAAVAFVAAAMALLIPIPRGKVGEHLRAAQELGVAAPLGEPAYGLER
jgi:hypothetical protein